MLTKFPVTTDRGEYRVDIKDVHADGDVIYEIDVYVPYLKWKIFRKFEYVGSCDAGEKYRNRFIEAAMDAVKLCEDHVEEIAQSNRGRTEAIEAFRNWDGDMTTKGESR